MFLLYTQDINYFIIISSQHKLHFLEVSSMKNYNSEDSILDGNIHSSINSMKNIDELEKLDIISNIILKAITNKKSFKKGA